MAFEEERKVFNRFIRNKNLRHSEQRLQIMDVFLKTEKHLSAEDLYDMVRKKNPSIGYATIYRTMKLLTEAGLCRELQADDRTTRYEHLHNHEHHDHLICTECGKMVEFEVPEIEDLQEKTARENGFILKNHRLELYGLCSNCS